MADGEVYPIFVDSRPDLTLPGQATDEIAVIRSGVTYKMAPTDFAGSGTVISVDFAGDGVVLDSTPGTPVTTTGTLQAVLLAQTAHLFLGGPTTAGPTNPTFRAILEADLPADLAYLDHVQTFTVAQRGQPITVTPSGSTFTPDMAAGQHFNIDLVSGSNTLANPTNIVAGQVGMLRVTQSSGGGDTLSFGGDFVFASGSPPALSAGASAKDYFGYYVDDATHIVISAGILNVS